MKRKVLGLVIAAGTVMAQAGPPVWLSPMGVPFDINKERRGVSLVHGFQISGDNLYFLVSSDPGFNASTLVCTGLAGRVERVVQLGPGRAVDMAVSGSGTVFVRYESDSPASEDVLRTYNNAGAEVGPPRELKSFGKLTVLAGTPVGAAANGGVSRLDPELPPRLELRIPKIDHADMVIALSGDSLAVVDRSEGEIRLANLSKKEGRSLKVESPEVEKARAVISGDPKGPGFRQMLVQTGASDLSGNLYLMLTGFRPAEGAPVLVLNAEGKLVRTLRCEIPKGTDGKYAVPLEMGVAGDVLYLVGSDGLVARYPLPRN